MFIVSVIVQSNCYILSALLLDEALKLATPLSNGPKGKPGRDPPGA